MRSNIARPHGVGERPKEELNVREMKFLEDDNRARRAPRPSLLGHGRAEAVGREAQIIKFDFGEVGADCLMIQRIVPEGLAVDADSHFTVALDLNVTDELRRACVAGELVNRIQNRRKEQNFAITDRINIELYSESEVLKLAVKENEAYITGETQANAIIWKDSAAGLQDTDADGEKVAVEAVKA